MAIPSKQIGWSQKANLLWQIAKQLESLTGVMGKNITTSTTSTSSTTTTTTTAAPAGYYYEVLVTNPGACTTSFVDNWYSDVPSAIDVWYNQVEPYPGAGFTISYHILGAGTPGPSYGDLTTVIQTVTPAGSCVA
jgi:hypothetical protein